MYDPHSYECYLSSAEKDLNGTTLTSVMSVQCSIGGLIVLYPPNGLFGLVTCVALTGSRPLNCKDHALTFKLLFLVAV